MLPTVLGDHEIPKEQRIKTMKRLANEGRFFFFKAMNKEIDVYTKA